MYPKPILGYGLCECGCGQTTGISASSNPRIGIVRGKPARFVRGHYSLMGPVAFWSNVPDHLPGDVCWPWQGRSNADGYGRWGKRLAYHVLYETLVGPVPDGLQLDHLCRNRICVNPAHLEPVTQRENCLRARKTNCQHGHPLSGPNVSPERKCRTCRRVYLREYQRRRAQERRANA